MYHDENIEKAKSLFTEELLPILGEWFRGNRFEESVSSIENDAHLNGLRWGVKDVDFEADTKKDC